MQHSVIRIPESRFPRAASSQPVSECYLTEILARWACRALRDEIILVARRYVTDINPGCQAIRDMRSTRNKFLATSCQVLGSSCAARRRGDSCWLHRRANCSALLPNHPMPLRRRSRSRGSKRSRSDYSLNFEVMNSIKASRAYCRSDPTMDVGERFMAFFGESCIPCPRVQIKSMATQ